MTSVKEIVVQVHSAMLAAFQTNTTTTSSISKEYESLTGTNLAADLKQFNISSIDEMLSMRQDLFEKLGSSNWRAIPNKKVGEVLRVMAKSGKNQQRGGNNRLKNGIDRVQPKRTRQNMGARTSAFYKSNDKRFFNHGGFQNRKELIRSRSPSPLDRLITQRRGYSKERDFEKNNYQDQFYQSRSRNLEGPSDHRARSRSREYYYDSRSRDNSLRRYSPRQSRSRFQDYDNESKPREISPRQSPRYQPRSRSREYDFDSEAQPSSFHDKQLTSCGDDFWAQNCSNQFGVRVPITNDEMDIRAGVHNLSIKPEKKEQTRKRTKQAIAELMKNILITACGCLKIDELIALTEKELKTNLPLEKYHGPIGLLKKLKSDKPEILKMMIIDEEKNTVRMLSSRPSSTISSTSKHSEADHEVRKKLDRINGIDDIQHQLEQIVGNQLTMANALQRIIFNDDEEDKVTTIALAVLTSSKFKLSKIGRDGVITRKFPESSDHNKIIEKETPGLPKEYKMRFRCIFPSSGESIFEVQMLKFTALNKPFFVRLIEDLKDYEKMQNEIREMSYGAEPRKLSLSDWRINDGCLVESYDLNNDDDQCTSLSWNRAIVTRIDREDNLIVVRLIDTGFIKSFKVDEIYPMPKSINEKPPFALECRLKQFSIEDHEGFDLAQEVWVEKFSRNNLKLKIKLLDMEDNKQIVALKRITPSGREVDILAELCENGVISY